MFTGPTELTNLQYIGEVDLPLQVKFQWTLQWPESSSCPPGTCPGSFAIFPLLCPPAVLRSLFWRQGLACFHTCL